MAYLAWKKTGKILALLARNARGRRVVLLRQVAAQHGEQMLRDELASLAELELANRYLGCSTGTLPVQ